MDRQPKTYTACMVYTTSQSLPDRMQCRCSFHALMLYRYYSLLHVPIILLLHAKFL